MIAGRRSACRLAGGKEDGLAVQTGLPAKSEPSKDRQAKERQSGRA